jgi:DNA-binding LacI/PurR family transcriptional regulator
MVKRAENNTRLNTPDKSGNMDLRALARLANVSISTVSRSINKVSAVNPKTAKRVWQAIAELNYFPNTQARAVVSGAAGCATLANPKGLSNELLLQRSPVAEAMARFR